MGETYPLIVAARPLIPGRRMTVRGDSADLRPGSRIVIAMRQSAGEPSAVGTIALVWGVRREPPWPDLIDVRGELLATVAATMDEGSLVGDVATVEGDRPVAPEFLEDVQRALRTYMAARAEAGEGGDITVTLSSNPVTASHQVASMLRISSPEVQEVLEAGDAGARLTRSLAVLRRETGLLHRTMGDRGE